MATPRVCKQHAEVTSAQQSRHAHAPAPHRTPGPVKAGVQQRCCPPLVQASLETTDLTINNPTSRCQATWLINRVPVHLTGHFNPMAKENWGCAIKQSIGVMTHAFQRQVWWKNEHKWDQGVCYPGLKGLLPPLLWEQPLPPCAARTVGHMSVPRSRRHLLGADVSELPARGAVQEYLEDVPTTRHRRPWRWGFGSVEGRPQPQEEADTHVESSRKTRPGAGEMTRDSRTQLGSAWEHCTEASKPRRRPGTPSW